MKIQVDLTPLTAKALEETWVKKDDGGNVEREIIFTVSHEAWVVIWNALPCTERFTWPIGFDGHPTGDLHDIVLRRPVVFRRVHP